MGNVINFRERKFNIYELYKRGKLDESCDLLIDTMCNANIEGLNMEQLLSEDAEGEIDLYGVFLENKSLLDFIEKNLNQEELIVGQVHLLKVFDDIISSNEYTDREKICVFEEFSENISKINSLLSMQMAAECCLNIVQGDYEELKEILRMTAIYASQAEYGTPLKTRLENVLEKYIPMLESEYQDMLEELIMETENKINLKQFINMFTN